MIERRKYKGDCIAMDTDKAIKNLDGLNVKRKLKAKKKMQTKGGDFPNIRKLCGIDAN